MGKWGLGSETQAAGALGLTPVKSQESKPPSECPTFGGTTPRKKETWRSDTLGKLGAPPKQILPLLKHANKTTIQTPRPDLRA